MLTKLRMAPPSEAALDAAFQAADTNGDNQTLTLTPTQTQTPTLTPTPTSTPTPTPTRRQPDILHRVHPHPHARVQLQARAPSQECESLEGGASALAPRHRLLRAFRGLSRGELPKKADTAVQAWHADSNSTLRLYPPWAVRWVALMAVARAPGSSRCRTQQSPMCMMCVTCSVSGCPV